MKILILGADGYIGWPLSRELVLDGCDVYRFDNYIRRELAESVIPIGEPGERAIHEGHATIYEYVVSAIQECQPDALVHLAQLPSAAYSMMGYAECVQTQIGNLLSTLNILYAMKEFAPDAHLVKLGSMGEYGTPNRVLREGPQEKDPGSWYHASKVHDSTNIQFACKAWGLRATDVMQGIVYGINGKPYTRLDVDECFGTVVHRFCAQKVIDMPLTVYGGGMQQRSVLPLGDSIQCLKLLIENPPDEGEYRVVHQFHEVYSVIDIAKKVSDNIQFIENPRVEMPDHFYQPEAKILPELGYKPDSSLDEEIDKLVEVCSRYRDRINPAVMLPRIKWSK